MMGILSIKKRHRHPIFPPQQTLDTKETSRHREEIESLGPIDHPSLELERFTRTTFYNLRTDQLEMEFKTLNNSVESSVTGSREGPPIIDSSSREPPLSVS